jgi:NCAIR mutase (PurE)-related protein
MTWSERPFDAVRRALAGDNVLSTDGSVRIDADRAVRTGAPEIVLAGTKSMEIVEQSLRRLATLNGRAIATRCRDDQLVELPKRLDRDFEVLVVEVARSLVVALPGRIPARTGGRIGIITAGSSDIPVAAEAALVARELGCDVDEIRDVGVAGLHRLIQPLERLAEKKAHAIIVAAGMDGALPSVVAGLVPVPVIGLPTSVGYGFGGGGTAALSTMLQTCAPGLVVVNIDNGVGAAIAAAKIANQVAFAESAGSSVG